MGKKKQGKETEQEQKRETKKQERECRKEFRREKFRRIYGKDEWDREFKKFLGKLLPLGYFIREVTGDGNCFFRSIADQLGEEGLQHPEVRARIVQYIAKNRPDFEPFIEDDVPFDRYVSEMAKNATWGGNLELQACSKVFEVNIKIFQLDLPCWDVTNWPPTTRTLFLSYHDGDHWNSVRPLMDMTAQESAKISSLLGVKILSGSNPAEIEALIKSECSSSSVSQQQLLLPKPAEPTKEEKIVMENTGEELEKVRTMLAAFDGDVDTVISEIYRIRYEEDGDDGEDGIESYGSEGTKEAVAETRRKEYIILATNTGDSPYDKRKKAAPSEPPKRKHLTKKQLKEQKKAQKRNVKTEDSDVKVVSVNGRGDALIPSQKI